MTKTSNAQTLQLESLVAGVTYMLVITKATGTNSTLQFKHLGDADPINHPAHTAVTGATTVSQFLCPSPVMALVFAAPPSQNYHVSVLPITQQEF